MKNASHDNEWRFGPPLHHLVGQGVPRRELGVDDDLKLGLHLVQDAPALGLVEEAGHAGRVHRDRSGADGGDHTLQHLLSHLTGNGIAMDLSGTFTNMGTCDENFNTNWSLKYEETNANIPH